MPGIVIDIIAVVVIPLIIELLKKLKLPKAIAPLVALGLAAVYVIVGKQLGLPGTDFQTALDYITKILGISAISVFGYDVVKKLIFKT